MESDVQFTNPTTLTVERTLPGPIERVWAYLTEPDKRARWLGGGALGHFVVRAVESISITGIYQSTNSLLLPQYIHIAIS